MLKDFKEFILRGNVVQLAVAIVIGIAFGAVVSSFVEDLLTPLIAAIFGEPDFSALTFEVNGSTFRYGDFINAIISFLIVAAAIFFLVIRPMNVLEERRRRRAPEDPTLKKCPECISEIPADATRCAFCTTAV
jgi:large conductance mechanosensitive channel